MGNRTVDERWDGRRQAATPRVMHAQSASACRALSSMANTLSDTYG